MSTHGTTGAHTSASSPGTYLFLTQDGSSGAGAGIFQDDGVLVWWTGTGGVDDYNLMVVNYQGQPYLALWTGTSPPDNSYGDGSITVYNTHYQVVGHVAAGGSYAGNRVDFHEFNVTPQGDALVGVYDPVRMTVNGAAITVLDYVVQKVSLVHDSSGIHTGSVLFQWKSLTDVPVSKSHDPVPLAGGTDDYFHGNAISQDSDGNLVVSSRNTWGVYKLDATAGTSRYGHVVWQVGAPGDHALSEPWCYEHDVASLGNDEYSLYDDGGTGPGCVPGSTQHPARGLIVKVNPATSPAGVSLVSSYSHSPAIYTKYTGGTQILGNGDALVDWANHPEITEYDRSGRQVKMDLAMSDFSYRGYRFAWDGQPLQPPSVAVHGTDRGTSVWASWNGSTEVSAWQVLGGPDAAHLSVVSPVVAKRQFETGMSVSGHYAVVAVRALSASGAVLATSPAVAGTGYLLATSKGNVYNFGDAAWYGSKSGQAIPAPVTGIADTPDGAGYWLATSKGNVYNFGAAAWYGSKALATLPAPVVASTAG